MAGVILTADAPTLRSDAKAEVAIQIPKTNNGEAVNRNLIVVTMS